MVPVETTPAFDIEISGVPPEYTLILNKIIANKEFLGGIRRPIKSISFTVDTSGIESEISNTRFTNKIVAKYIPKLLAFLKSPVIQDTLSNGDERRKWRSDLSPDIRQFIELNKLRRTSLLTVRVISQILVYSEIDVSPFIEQAEKLEQHLSQNVLSSGTDFSAKDVADLVIDPYEKLEYKEKLELVEEADSLAMQMIKYLCEQYRTPIE